MSSRCAAYCTPETPTESFDSKVSPDALYNLGFRVRHYTNYNLKGRTKAAQKNRVDMAEGHTGGGRCEREYDLV